MLGMKSMNPTGPIKESKNRVYALLAAHGEDRPKRLAHCPSGHASWSPQISLFDTRDAFEIEILIPGIDPTRISVTLEGSFLVFHGEKEVKTDLLPMETGVVSSKGRRFVRKVKLPFGLDIHRMQIDSNEDALRVITPKKRKRVA